jgi:hypothetical protein
MGRRLRAIAIAVALVGALVFAGEARAQTATGDAAPPPSAAASPPAKDQGASIATMPQGPATLVLPALTLTAPSLLPGQRYVPGCDAEAQTRGNSEAPGTGAGLPFMGSAHFELAPRLSLLAFSRLGCPITSGVGAVVAYDLPVTPSLSFSLSGSLFAMPQALDKGTASRTLLRAELVDKSPSGGATQTLGVQALRARGTSSTTTVGATYGLHW